ncbi:MAG: hypothetical protein LBE16_04895, partial [Clostridiales Family XIII bacterium]|nr:hypothetical protein [Clostridiales Family XIII bacterium]
GVTTRADGLEAPADIETLYEGAGDSFDLAWAVDENGLPADIDAIRYIKIQSTTESPEVNVVSRAPEEASPVGLSAAPARILVDGAALPLKEGLYEYDAAVRGAFAVEVEAEAGANVYINNLRAASREFALTPGKGLIRVIVQEGKKEPRIYLIRVSGTPFSDAETERR